MLAISGTAFLLFVFCYFSSDKNIKRNFYFGLSTYLLSFAFGAATLQVHSGYFQQSNYIHQVKNSDSHLLEIVLREKLKSSVYKDRYIAIVKRVDRKKSSGKILINFDKGLSKSFVIGTNIKINGEVVRHKTPYNPNQFDYGQYLTDKSILAQMYGTSQNILVSKSIDKDAFYYSNALRNRILKNLKKSIAPKELNVIAALLLGQQQEISSDVLHDYQFAGAIHILSVSGLHVGFIMIFMTFLLNFLPKNRWTSIFKLTAVIGSLWGFAVLAGLSPSVIRSVTMFSFVAVGLHLKRKTNIFHTLLVSLLLILVFEPSFLFDVGFQLSYVALFFILWLQPIFSDFWQPENKIIKYFWDILTVSFAAQIGAFPLSVYYFHQFPGLFFATNLIIIPFLSVIMAVGVLVMILAVFNAVPDFLAKTLEYTIVILNKIINWVASFDTFVVQDIPFNKGMLVALYFFLVAFFLCFRKPDSRKITFASSALILFVVSYFATIKVSQNQKEWIVFNAKHSTLIVARTGKNITVFSNGKIQNNNILKSYAVANFAQVTNRRPIKNMAYFNNRKILIVDSLGQYPEKIAPDVLLLRQSPKINLARLLQHCKPKMIVADCSNYKSYVALWKKTCAQQKIPFHAIAEKGFYRLN
ncbi:ComEC/Rec2 family competence protein [Flavobacterium noncentrifugens]|nr:ComEC/Rec2 family competence protein [Flavobacterium noncentrifugens]